MAPAAPAKVTLKLDKVAKEELVAPALPVSVPEPLPAPKLVEAAPAPAAPTPAPVMVAEKQAEAPKPVAAAAPAPVAATEGECWMGLLQHAVGAVLQRAVGWEWARRVRR